MTVPVPDPLVLGLLDLAVERRRQAAVALLDKALEELFQDRCVAAGTMTAFRAAFERFSEAQEMLLAEQSRVP